MIKCVYVYMNRIPRSIKVFCNDRTIRTHTTNIIQTWRPSATPRASWTRRLSSVQSTHTLLRLGCLSPVSDVCLHVESGSSPLPPTSPPSPRAEIPNASLYLLRDEYRTLVSTSTASLLVSTVPSAAPSPPVEVYLLVLDDYQVVCSAATVVLQISAGQYLFPGDDCTRALLLPQEAEAEALEALEAVLAAHCTFRRAPRAPPILSIPDVRSSAEETEGSICLLSRRFLFVLRACGLYFCIFVSRVAHSHQASERWANVGLSVAAGLQRGATVVSGGIRTASALVGQGMHKCAFGHIAITMSLILLVD
jgi:hypothetical protein